MKLKCKYNGIIFTEKELRENYKKELEEDELTEMEYSFEKWVKNLLDTNEYVETNIRTREEIIEYLGLEDNDNKQVVDLIVNEAIQIEKDFENENINYILKVDYFIYADYKNLEIIEETKNLFVFVTKD